jgi:hypothetical protein
MSDNRVHPAFAPLTRRAGLRVRAAGLCTELTDDSEQLGLLLDVSETGIRVERPHRLRPTPGRERVVQLEFEHPGIDELVWAKGVIRFDKLEPVRENGRVAGARRTSGVEIVAAASRHLRMLREFVLDLRTRDEADPLEVVHDSMWSSAFALG